jgi:hypothetical protein
MSARDIIALCQRNVGRYNNDCAGFVRAVAQACGVLMTGSANTIVAMLNTGRFVAGGAAAKEAAAAGQLVIAGLAAPGHGHVAIVVSGPLNPGGKYPYAFWGQYHGLNVLGETVNVGFSRGHGPLNWAFKDTDRDKVKYAAFQPLELLLPKARASEGLMIYTFT